MTTAGERNTATGRERAALFTRKRQAWPDPIPDSALYGPAGDFVRGARDHTEADPNGLYVAALTAAGLSLSGWGPHLPVGDRRHGPLLFTALVGRSSRARKGTTTDPVYAALAIAEPDVPLRGGGFGSGEAFVEALSERPRLLLDEAELASVLIASARDGSTLGQNIRMAWDGSPLRRRTVKKTTEVVAYFVAALASCTLPELDRALSATDLYGGTINRLLWCAIERSGLKPRTKGVPLAVVEAFAEAVQASNEWLAALGKPLVSALSDDAMRLWADEGLYERLEEDEQPGAFGEAIGRSSQQTLRLALVCSLLDQSATIERAHLIAAEAVWRYCRDSAAHVFGESTGDHRADRVLDHLGRTGDKGIARSELPAVLGSKNIPASEFNRLRDLLLASGRIVVANESSPGRKTVERWSLAGESPKHPKSPKDYSANGRSESPTTPNSRKVSRIATPAAVERSGERLGDLGSMGALPAVPVGWPSSKRRR